MARGTIVEDIVRAPYEHHRTWADSPLLKERAFARRDAPLDRAEDIPPPEAWREGAAFETFQAEVFHE